MDGFILVDKIEGITSYDVIKIIKRKLNIKKVGHCGTLDPFASGLLIIGINQATKLMNYLLNDYKEYEAEITLGSATDTYDLTGKVMESSEILSYSKEEIEEVLHSFLGEIEQIPPIYSAIHVDGKHLYEYARNNEKVDIPSRKVIIKKIELVDYSMDKIRFRCLCSKGTYIRTLGYDIALKLKMVGHLSKLKRLSIGNFDLSKANSYEDLINDRMKIIPISEAVLFKTLHIKDVSILKRVYNGQDIILKNETDDLIAIQDNDNMIAVYKRIDGAIFHCERGLFDENIKYKRLTELQ